MGNLQKLGHPFSKTWMENQLALQHKILKRLGELGISPILPAFNLHVPQQLGAVANSERSSFWSGFYNEFSGVLRLDICFSLRRSVINKVKRRMRLRLTN